MNAHPLARFALVTGNPNKLDEAKRILDLELESVAIDLPELQSNNLEEVLRAKSAEAWNRVRRPVIVEETGLELNSMNGFPGPLVKWMLDSIGSEGIARAAHSLGDPGVTARCQLLAYDGERSVFAEGLTRGELVLPPRGADGFGWDPVFQPSGSSETYAELGRGTKDEIGHRGRAWRALLERVD